MKYYYLIHVQYLGFRYHGWQKQTKHKSVQGTIEDCIIKILGTENFSTIGASRTDSMVSAMHSCFELISPVEIDNELFLTDLNKLLPQDIKLLKCETVDSKFKIIGNARMKEYLYFFSYGEKNHPFAAPFMTHINEDLNIELMKEAARRFMGVHNFKNYCYRPTENQNFEREIIFSEITINDVFNADFFPERSFIFRVKAKSFMRHQVRLMAGILFRVGMNQYSISELVDSLENPVENFPSMIAPASGLILNKMTLDNE